jgi:hypothetical protein
MNTVYLGYTKKRTDAAWIGEWFKAVSQHRASTPRFKTEIQHNETTQIDDDVAQSEVNGWIQ